MFKYTKHSLKKIEQLFEELGYQIRYEKGSFQSGYCMVENRNIAVVNKFYDTEARINVLFEILGKVEVNQEQLSEAAGKFYKQILKLETQTEEGEAEETQVETATVATPETSTEESTHE